MHDVDLIPENDKINYGVKYRPNIFLQVSAPFNIISFKFFWGVASLWSTHFDDNLYSELSKKQIKA